MRKMYTEPRWKEVLINTTHPIFSPQQCAHIIHVGHQQPPKTAEVGITKVEGRVNKKQRLTTISWIPFKVLPMMYNRVEQVMNSVNNNCFGLEGLVVNQQAQFTEYSKGGFYDFHIDSDTSLKNEPPVRKLSMIVHLSKPSEFKGGHFEFIDKGNRPAPLKQGHAYFFPSYMRHRVTAVTKGIRRSLVMWFGGPPLK